WRVDASRSVRQDYVQSTTNFLDRNSGNEERLVARPIAADDLNGLSGHIERLGQERDHGSVCGGINRRRGHADEQTAVARAIDGRTRRSRNYSNIEADAARGRRDHARVRRPKIAVPTRTIVAPSSMATSKSWLMPIDSSR